MLAILLAIIAVLVIGGTLFYFFSEHIDYLISMWDWAQTAVAAVVEVVPAWVLPFASVALGLSILGIIIKLL